MKQKFKVFTLMLCVVLISLSTSTNVYANNNHNPTFTIQRSDSCYYSFKSTIIIEFPDNNARIPGMCVHRVSTASELRSSSVVRVNMLNTASNSACQVSASYNLTAEIRLPSGTLLNSVSREGTVFPARWAWEDIHVSSGATISVSVVFTIKGAQFPPITDSMRVP